MKIKALIYVAFLLVVPSIGYCIERYPLKVTFHVVDDFGRPVPDVEMAMATFDHWQPGQGFGKDISNIVTGITNREGNVVLNQDSLDGRVAFNPRQKVGFYSSGGEEFTFKEVKDGKWQPWNPTVEVVFKPVLKPIAMYAKRVGELPRALELPRKNAPVGYDLMAGDWVGPYGKGSVADLIFTLTENVPFVDPEKPFDVTLSVTFSKKGDGIQSVLAAPYKGSDLRLPRYAPEDDYEPQLVKQLGRPAEDKPIDQGVRGDQNYFVRVRTVLDDKGRVKSALYGKIASDILVDVINSKTGLLQFTYYLNPSPNDRNMEFDPSRNLFGKLPSSEEVTVP